MAKTATKNSKTAHKKTDAAKSEGLKKIAANIALAEAHKELEKEGKKIVAPKRGRKAKVPEAVPAVKVGPVDVPTTGPELQELFSRIEQRMVGKSAGTVESCKSLVAKVCRKYGVATVNEGLAKRAVEESGLPPRSKANLRWAMKIASSV